VDSNSIVKVVFSLGVNKDFDYLLPKDIDCQIGTRVLVEFGKLKKTGIVVSLHRHSKIKNLKPIIKVLDSSPCLSKESIDFARMISEQYMYPLGEIVFMMLPALLKGKSFLEIAPSDNTDHNRPSTIEISKATSFNDRYFLYKDRVNEALKVGSVLICVPLVTDIDKVLGCFPEEFLEKKVIISSRQTQTENLNNWNLSRSGKKLIVGTRTALLHYPPDLSLIIVEKEYNSSYLQGQMPYYHLLDLALLLSKFKKVPLILSSDYPCVDTYKRLKEKEYTINEDNAQEKFVDVLDAGSFHSKRPSIFTPFIVELIRKRLSSGENILILWNKLKFSSILKCENCGHVCECLRCSSFLKLSLADGLAVCSLCGYKEEIPKICKVCNSGYIKPVGVGIERLEGIVKKFFPDFEVANAEKATPMTRIILSTPKIVNHYDELNLKVGSAFILDIDGMLSAIDYETTFNAFVYIKNVAKIVDEKIYVFTHNLKHYLWGQINEKWNCFYDKELLLRKQFKFPPYGILAKIIIRTKNKNNILKKAQSIYNALESKGLEVFGPLEETPFKLRDYYRYSVVAKSSDRKKLLNDFYEVLKKRKRDSCKIAVIIR